MLYTVERTFEPKKFEKEKDSIDIVCAGDSLTGWNNTLQHPMIWPFPTYPEFLKEKIKENKQNLTIANAGIAGAKSLLGFFAVMGYLDLFKNAEYFIINFGINDIAEDDFKQASNKTIDNLKILADTILEKGKKLYILNIPKINTSLWPENMIKELTEKRNYHNQKLKKVFSDNIIIDIYSKLKDEHLGDAIHPNEKGAKIIAQEVYSALFEK